MLLLLSKQSKLPAALHPCNCPPLRNKPKVVKHSPGTKVTCHTNEFSVRAFYFAYNVTLLRPGACIIPAISLFRCRRRRQNCPQYILAWLVCGIGPRRKSSISFSSTKMLPHRTTVTTVVHQGNAHTHRIPSFHPFSRPCMFSFLSATPLVTILFHKLFSYGPKIYG